MKPPRFLRPCKSVSQLRRSRRHWPLSVSARPGLNNSGKYCYGSSRNVQACYRSLQVHSFCTVRSLRLVCSYFIYVFPRRRASGWRISSGCSANRQSPVDAPFPTSVTCSDRWTDRRAWPAHVNWSPTACRYWQWHSRQIYTHGWACKRIKVGSADAEFASFRLA